MVCTGHGKSLKTIFILITLLCKINVMFSLELLLLFVVIMHYQWFALG